jgi:hypothetical protein
MATASEPGTSKPKASNSARLPKQLNLGTYKFHSLGDYPQHIRRFGTIDSYSTQPVSLSQPRIKENILTLVSIRANGNTELLKEGTFGLMGDQFPSNCRTSNNANAASAQFAKT